jgi:hypothetical protein
MDVVTVFIAKALICFGGACHPALVGENTLPGTYPMTVMYTEKPGYGGDVLVYRETEDARFSVHRTYTLDRRRNRAELYDGTTPEERTVTAGCVNVEPELYEELRDNYRRHPLIILP